MLVLVEEEEEEEEEKADDADDADDAEDVGRAEVAGLIEGRRVGKIACDKDVVA